MLACWYLLPIWLQLQPHFPFRMPLWQTHVPQKISDLAVNEALAIWKSLSRAEELVAPGNCFQKVWDNTVTSEIYENLISNNNIDKARLKAAGAARAQTG